jgi:hypothetical protein
MPKCIEFNAELILVLGFSLGPHPRPRTNIYFFWGKSLIVVRDLVKVRLQGSIR